MKSPWENLLIDEFKKPYMKDLKDFLDTERISKTIYPPKESIFEAFNQTPFDQVKVVIIGQDPYHGPGQAHGLSFSVPEGIEPPPSLKNIFKELKTDLEITSPSHGCLVSWAKQGVLLLNSTLTVRANEAGSHQFKGWEQFTDKVVSLLTEKTDPIVFLLWGKSAFEKLPNNKTPHLVLTAPHPSPLSAYRGFFGCRHFSKANTFLKKQGKTEINWDLSL